MKFTIAQIGTNRLQKVLLTNKGQDPNVIVEALKCDIKKVLESYMDDFCVDIQANQIQESVVFDIKVKANRIKSFGTLPY